METMHPYLEKKTFIPENLKEILKELNYERENSRGDNIEVDYYFKVNNDGKPLSGLKNAIKMVLEHGTIKPWHNEGDIKIKKPAHYDENMAWVVDIKRIDSNKTENTESGIVTIAYPVFFFDKVPHKEFPLSQLMMAIASEPVSGFSMYQDSRIIDIRLPESLKERFPGIKWSHKRIRKYLGISETEPIIGTIVKPKTGLTPLLFSNAVVESAKAGAKFVKADENMHLTLKEVSKYVSRTVKDLEKEGFDLGKGKQKGKRFLFAPHITTDPKHIMDYAKAAIESGANCLMFSPYYSGGFTILSEIVEKFDVPVYSHTAGMNIITGCSEWGIAPSIMYMFAVCFGAAFMQLPAVKGYIKPDDLEKEQILKKLRSENLEGNNGMTLVIAGGIGPSNLGYNMKILGIEGRMFLAGTSVYSHPDGISAGVKALILAYRAYKEKNITEVSELIDYARQLGREGIPLLNALINPLL
jgi:ribulose 1,5-bisphosphate carboxylase large subunit-like protein